MFEVTWKGAEKRVVGRLTFEPGETKVFDSTEEMPPDILEDAGFVVVDVDSGEIEIASDDGMEGGDVEVEGGGSDRARGTIPRFTELPRPGDDTDRG